MTASWLACVRERQTRRSSSTATTAWAGASSARRGSYRGSRAAPPTRKAGKPQRTGGSGAVTPARDTGKSERFEGILWIVAWRARWKRRQRQNSLPSGSATRTN